MAETVPLPDWIIEAPSPAPLNASNLAALLGQLAARQGPVPKYLYPSAGTLYPVRAYLFLRHPLGDVPAGAWYYDPDAHALLLTSSHVPPAPDGSTPAAMLLLAAHRPAIAPIYHADADAFCLLEAGYMADVLAEAGLRLREAGEPASLAADAALETGDVPLVCWAIEGGG